MKIVVIGGTGLIGSKVVSNLRQMGHEVIAAAPNTGVNTITGEGLIRSSRGRADRHRRRELPLVRGRSRAGFLQDGGP